MALLGYHTSWRGSGAEGAWQRAQVATGQEPAGQEWAGQERAAPGSEAQRAELSGKLFLQHILKDIFQPTTWSEARGSRDVSQPTTLSEASDSRDLF